MAYPPGQGKSGDFLMYLWRRYLEEYADRDGDVEGQIVAGANSTVEILTALSRTLDGGNRYRDVIDQRCAIFNEGTRRAVLFEDRLLNATFSIYNSLNTLSHQIAEGNAQALGMIRSVDEQAQLGIKSGTQIARSAAALRACFALVGLMALALDDRQAMTPAIRQLERRYASGAQAAGTDWEHLLNALYRIVEMMQLLALLTDPELKDRIAQIASRFQEEDLPRGIQLKMRNGFCRFFELGHLLISRVDATL
ncbi:MAG: hypothetical protein JW793_04395 [Acidobacteria bacterium]|nr:hypothetical protein [Acidobacteriota bacterium]